jgi:hypothetical protein
MRKKREPESEEYLTERATRRARERVADASAEGRALDAAVRDSIKQHGP